MSTFFSSIDEPKKTKKGKKKVSELLGTVTMKYITNPDRHFERETSNQDPQMTISLVKELSCVPQSSLELFNHNMDHCSQLWPPDWSVLDSHDHMVGSDIPSCYLPVTDVSSKNDYFI